MKLLTHNMLACHIKGVTNNFPLKIEATKVRRREEKEMKGKIECETNQEQAVVAARVPFSQPQPRPRSLLFLPSPRLKPGRNHRGGL